MIIAEVYDYSLSLRLRFEFIQTPKWHGKIALLALRSLQSGGC